MRALARMGLKSSELCSKSIEGISEMMQPGNDEAAN